MKKVNSSSSEKVKTVNDILKSPLPSQLNLTIKLNTYEKLSNESKWLIDIIIHTPTDYKDLLVDGKNNITRRSVKKFVTQIWPSYTIGYVFRELKKWVSTF